MAGDLIEPARDQILRYCADDPIERVFLEDVARRGLGRFVARESGGELSALCHLGINAVPSGAGCGEFARDVARTGPRMLIGEECAVTDLWNEVRSRLPRPREDRPGQPVYAIREAPERGGTGLRPAELSDLDVLMPACATAHEQEIGVDPMKRDPDGFRWRTRSQIEDGRSWLWVEDGAIRFKAEASAWTPEAVQLQQVWVDPAVRQRGYGARGLADLCRLLLERVPTVCLFVRAENDPAIRLYEAIGMRHVLAYRSLLF
ncbi:MAG TPA: GNAT family N-acetyltransferase [Gaiellaceae bacterium]